MGIASELIYGAEVPVPRRGSTAELNAIYMLSPQEGWDMGRVTCITCGRELAISLHHLHDTLCQLTRADVSA